MKVNVHSILRLRSNIYDRNQHESSDETFLRPILRPLMTRVREAVREEREAMIITQSEAGQVIGISKIEVRQSGDVLQDYTCEL